MDYAETDDIVRQCISDHHGVGNRIEKQFGKKNNKMVVSVRAECISAVTVSCVVYCIVTYCAAL